jgi:hypothetical protein
MENPADSIESAEQDVATRKATVRAQYDVLQAKLREQASSPKVIGGVLAGAIALGYLIMGGRGKQKRVVVTEKKSGTLSTMLDMARTLAPLLGSLHAARQAKSAKKTVAKATGTAPVPPDAEVQMPGQKTP